MTRRALFCALLLTAPAAAAAVRIEYRIVDSPISFSAARKAATRAYLKEHYGIDTGSISIEPRAVVVHWTAIGTREASFRAFDRETLPAGRPDVAKGGRLNVSAHFLIDRDGTIYRLMPETWMARHAIGLNHCAIGIENVGGVNGTDDLSEAQLEANARLIRDLKSRYPKIETVIGHHEYRTLENGSLWREKDAGYRTEKSDPGEPFMTRLRARLAGS